MNKRDLVRSWIDEEMEMERAEGTPESTFIKPREGLAPMMVNVIANHVDEFLEDKELVQNLKVLFQERGLIGEVWFVTLVGIGMEMNQAQLPILGWLMEGDSPEEHGMQTLSLSEVKNQGKRN